MRHLVSARKAAFLAVSIASLVVGCAGNGTDNSNNVQCPRTCPPSVFSADVPADRAADVASVTSAGPCASVSVAGAAPGFYFFRTTGEGLCQVTISFKSGAPAFVGSMNIVPSSGPCCLGEPTAVSAGISVPELGGLDGSTGN